MSASILQSLATDPSRFFGFGSRVAVLISEQVGLWKGDPSDWIVLPLGPEGQFTLLARDIEGEREGREVLAAFLGPHAAVSLTEANYDSDTRTRLGGAHVEHAFGIQPQAGMHERVLIQLEKLTAVRVTQDRVERSTPHDYVDDLRDLRLALRSGDATEALSAYRALQESGRLSQSNLRFLRIEVLASLGRWQELADLPFIAEMANVRRPRSISEALLAMFWHTRIEGTLTSPLTAFTASGLLERQHQVLNSVDVPIVREAAALCLLAAHAQGDRDRVDRILLSLDEPDRESLSELLQEGGSGSSRPDEPRIVKQLLEQGLFGSAVAEFLRQPSMQDLDPVLEAALELRDPELATQLIVEVERLFGDLTPNRRIRRDLDELGLVSSSSCSGWIEWFSRVSSESRWSNASAVARESASRWTVEMSSGVDQSQIADHLVAASSGANEDQLRAVLDLLCELAEHTARTTHQFEVLEAVLLVLSDQENVSTSVLASFSDLVWTALECGPQAQSYRDLVATADSLWTKVAAPATLDWIVGLTDAFLTYPSVDSAALLQLGARVIALIAPFESRLSSRQLADIRNLCLDLGLDPWPNTLPSHESEESIWRLLDGRSVGLYSLLPGIGPKVSRALNALCSLGGFEHREDTVASQGLKSMANRCDFLVVDTWHASHAATGCLDEVVDPRRQIRPRRGGAPAIVAAIEADLRERIPSAPH